MSDFNIIKAFKCYCDHIFIKIKIIYINQITTKKKNTSDMVRKLKQNGKHKLSKDRHRRPRREKQKEQTKTKMNHERLRNVIPNNISEKRRTEWRCRA